MKFLNLIMSHLHKDLIFHTWRLFNRKTKSRIFGHFAYGPRVCEKLYPDIKKGLMEFWLSLLEQPIKFVLNLVIIIRS